MVYTKCHPWQDCQEKPYDPFGVNKPPTECRTNIHRMFQGDEEIIISNLCLVDGQVATPSNSYVTFTLKDQRFAREIIWEGHWQTGVEETDVPGTVSINIPQDITGALRRGSFLYAMDVANTTQSDRHTCEEGTILVEYGANAPIPDVPYRSDV